MTRLELLTLAVGRARMNGFNLKRWYTTRLGLPWISTDAALQILDTQRRYYALVFSHEFAGAFWKSGEEIVFKVPAQTFSRITSDGTVHTVNRKSHIRRSSRPDVWRYHLREMALADDPLRYLRKYLHLDQELEPDAESHKAQPKKAAIERKRPLPLPTQARSTRPSQPSLPRFLQRPYHGSQT